MTPVPVPVTPPPPPDTDGDGYTDDVDACPDQGDLGYGLNGDGCPKTDFQSRCEAVPGTYLPGGKSFYTVACDFLVTLTADQWNTTAPYVVDGCPSGSSQRRRRILG